MSQQMQGGTTYTNTAPGNVVNATNLDALVNAGSLTNGAVIDQNDVSSRAGNTRTLAADTLLLGDSTQADTSPPLKVRVDKVLLEAQVNGTQQFATGNSGGVGTAYVLALSPATTAYNGGEVVRFKTDAANTAGVTVNVDGNGVKNVVNRAGATLQANDLLSGQIAEIIYDAGNAWFVLMSAVPANSVTAADLAESVRDGVYYHQSAATTHTATGGVDTYTVTLSPAPTGLQTGMRFRFLVPAASNNTQPGKVILNYAVGNSGAISLVKFGALALVTNDVVSGCFCNVVYDGTNFVLMNPRGFDYLSAPTNSGAVSTATAFAHGLGVAPSKVRVVLVQTNSSAENGYNQNDEVAIESLFNSSSQPTYTVAADATNITVIRSSTAGVYMPPKGAGAVVDQGTNVNTPNFFWKLKVYASI